MLVPHLNLHLIRHYLSHWIRAKRKGHGVHSPFVYQLCEEVFYNENGFYDFEKLNSLREQLLKNKTRIEVLDLGAGSKVFKGKSRSISSITKSGISQRGQSELIYKLINFLKPKTIIELGTSIGLNTLYMASAAKGSKVYSIEGSVALFDFAKKLALENEITNSEFICGDFKEVLPELLKLLPTFDLMYIDGNHTYEATLNYFNLALNKKNTNSILIFDDIYWSRGMSKAWEEIKTHGEVKLSIDCFYFGLIFFKEEILVKQDLRLWI